MVTWEVLEKYQRSSMPVTYNIGLCVDESAYACYSTLTMCRGTYQYNASTSSGELYSFGLGGSSCGLIRDMILTGPPGKTV